MKIFSKLYNKAMHISDSKYAVYILAVVSFIESIFFPLPPDVLLISMVLANKSKAFKYFMITLLFSILGGIAGYFVGMFFIEFVYKYIVSYGYESAYIQVQHWFTKWGFWIVFIAGFTPIPYKIFTIGAGSFQMGLFPFIVASVISRGLRFGLVSFLVGKFEAKFTKIAVKYIDLIGWLMVVLLGLYFYIRNYYV
ncbi:MAG: DedA family protein [Legionellales bacterium]|nr:DedA family protein [Legionellales bacterium]